MRRGIQVTIIIAALWVMVSVSLSWPYQLSYFNEGAGGTRDGHKHMLGSSFDWGQSVLQVINSVNGEDADVRVAIRCSYDPFDVLTPPDNLKPWPEDCGPISNGVYIVSTSLILGEHWVPYDGLGSRVHVPLALFQDASVRLHEFPQFSEFTVDK
ncbi:MAG: hypothetical protein KDA69_03905, partial [Planctomycetaceae bacterium]|nr:hypothetical protein [Planctomycetaceae bacterium]